MRERLFALLGIESGEESMVSMLLTQSVFIGIFFGAFDISAHSLFLSIFDEKMMARGYVVSGIAGIILTSLYTWLQTKLQFRNFATINLFAVTAFTLILWVALVLSPAKWIIFIVFIMLGPLNILAMLGFWGTTGRLFTLRQGKRLFGLVDVGLIIGIIISCYAIPVILSLNFKSHNILLISASSILIASVIQILIGSRFSMAAGTVEKKSDKPKVKKSVFSVFREDNYTRIMGIFIALSVVTAFFVQYSFMAVTREQYPAEEDMARFLGIFTGSMMIFTLLVKLLVFSYLIRNYGLRTCLAVSPILVAAFTAIAIIIGMSMGYTPESTSGFLIFFLLLALSRLFSKSLKDSIESPSFKVIYQTIDEKIRYEVQSAMDGTVNEIAALSSGLLLAGLGVLSFVRLIHFSWVLFVIIILWVFVALRLYTEYRKSIRKALETVGQDGQVTEVLTDRNIPGNRFSAIRTFRTGYFKLITGDYSELETNRNKWYFEKIIYHTGSRHDTPLLPVLKKISADTNLDSGIRRLSSETLEHLEKHASSSDPTDEKTDYSRNLLSGNRKPQTTEILRLFRDNSIESKRLAIYMIGKFRLTDMLPELCESLNIPSLETDACSVLSVFGNDAFDELVRFYMVSSGNINTSKTILRLLGKMKTKESMGFLFSRLWSNSRQLKEVALDCLIESEFKASEEEKDRLHQLISDTVGLMTWNLSAKVCLGKHNDTFLLNILETERNRWKRYLFNILSITYDSGSVTKIKENLESETVESVNYALEMMDIVIDESIKPKLTALLDIIPDEEKLKNLYHFFPGEVPHYNRLIDDIINRDYNLISLWTKACTLRNLAEIEGDDMAESVAALLFSPETIIQEEAARLISRSSMELYKSVSQRIPVSTRNRLDRIVTGELDNNELLFEKIKFLADYFKGIPEDDLLALAGSMTLVKDFKSEIQSFPEGYIMWPLSGKDQGSSVYIQYNEPMHINDTNFMPVENTSYYIIPLNTLEEYQNHYPERSFEIIKNIESNVE
jgi:AAA family ATP:ADP antiporter